MEVKFLRVRENAKLPEKKHINDAGYDICWAPEPSDVTEKIWLNDVFYEKVKVISPGESVLLKTGLKCLFSPGYVLEIKNRSGIAAKKQLLVGACIVDSTYRGEIFVNVHNVSNKCQVIESGDRIAQFVIYPIMSIIPSEVTEDEYNENTTTRGDGGFGSTGLK